MSHPRFEVVRRLYRYACGYCGVTETDSGGEIKHRQVSEAIVEHLEATLPISGDTPSAVELQQPNAIALAREEAAYIKLHPTLKLTHLGRYVAIYQGKLIKPYSDLIFYSCNHRLVNGLLPVVEIKSE